MNELEESKKKLQPTLIIHPLTQNMLYKWINERIGFISGRTLELLYVFVHLSICILFFGLKGERLM